MKTEKAPKDFIKTLDGLSDLAKLTFAARWPKGLAVRGNLIFAAEKPANF
jgi:hypothetical protein